jgi:hypothetical protein
VGIGDVGGLDSVDSVPAPPPWCSQLCAPPAQACGQYRTAPPPFLLRSCSQSLNICSSLEPSCDCSITAPPPHRLGRCTRVPNICSSAWICRDPLCMCVCEDPVSTTDHSDSVPLPSLGGNRWLRDGDHHPVLLGRDELHLRVLHLGARLQRG